MHAILLGTGAIAILLALLWWSLVFGAIVSAGVLSPREATVCLVDSSGLCQAVAALCTQSHAFGLKMYSPDLLLMGLALLLSGIVARVFEFRPIPKRCCQVRRFEL